MPNRTNDFCIIINFSLFHFFKGEDYRHVFRASGRDTNWCALVLMMLLECTTCNVQRTAAVFTMAQKKKILFILSVYEFFFCQLKRVPRSFVNIFRKQMSFPYDIFFIFILSTICFWKFELNTNKAFYGEHRTTPISLCSAPFTCIVYHAASYWWC